ncbi:MAG TPA: ABC transporter transmembrane domain-containing protein, partial [Azospirillaceae bacterium]|nr:ABC transporter transmembrane domain-containing protein [Azospirillaceae bacterium]
MPFFTLLQRESRIVNGAFIALIIISGLSNAAVMAIINAAVETVEHHEENFRLLMMLVLVITLFVVSQRRLMGMVARQVEQVVHRLRVRLVERARRAELLEIENIGRSEIFSCISRETKTLSQASAPFVVAAQSAVLVTFTLLYIAWLSETAFALSVIFTAIGAAIHLLRSAEVKRKLREAYEYENQFLDTCSDLLDGFKEAKMDHARA